MTAGTRRNGTRRNGASRLGPFTRVVPGRKAQARTPVFEETVFEATAFEDAEFAFGGPSVFGGPSAFERDDAFAGQSPVAGRIVTDGHAGARGFDYAGRHASSPAKTARKRAGKAVPAAAAAATLVVGAAAYVMFGTGAGSKPQADQLNAALGVSASGAPSAGAGVANGSQGSVIKVTTAPGPGSQAGNHATATASARPPAAHSAPASTAAAAPQAHPASAATASTATRSSSSTKNLSCDLSGGLLPDNVSAIVSFLLAHGYSDNAAAGMAGNMYQESKGNPESEGMGGGGLIGWTPLPAGYVTGNVSADLQTQLTALLAYNEGWSQYIPELNAAASPADAAYIYVTLFERAGIPAAATREAAAEAVASACGN